MTTISDFTLHGFDVSHYQPEAPDFEQGGRVFGICKASESVGGRDTHLDNNRAQMHTQGLAAMGFYHFARPAKNSAAAEADHFLQVVGARQPGEFAVLDYEVDPWSEDWAVTWLNRVAAAGWPVVFYTYRAMLAPKPHAKIKATGAGLWLAGYSKTAPQVDGWSWLFWQHTNGTNAPDPNSPKWDCSVFHSNDIDELRRWSGVITPAPQPEEDDNMPKLVYRITDDATNNPIPGDNGVWASDGLKTYLLSEPALIHGANLDEFPKFGSVPWGVEKGPADCAIGHVPLASHAWRLANTQIAQGGGSVTMTQAEKDALVKQILDSEAERLKA